MARARWKESRRRRGESFAWDLTPLVVLAGLGVALLREPSGGAGRSAASSTRIERGRGRRAASPGQIPQAGWKDILLRTKTEFSNDQVPLVAAGVTFYTLLALFPGLAAFVGLYGLVADPADAYRQLQTLAFVLPPGAANVLGEQMVRLAGGDKGGQSLAFIGGVLLSIWGANGAVKALIVGLNIAYEEDERRTFLKRTLISLGFTLGFLAFVILTAAALAIGPAVEVFVGQQAGTIFRWASWAALALILALGLAVLYRYGPSRDPAKWRWITPGSLGVIAVWLIGSALFSLYVGNFAHYDRTYGSLGAVIGFMVWIYLSMTVILGGAELNSEIEHQTALDTTAGAPRPMGARGARMADTVGAAQRKDGKRRGAAAAPRALFR